MSQDRTKKKVKNVQKTIHWEPEVLQALENHMKREGINNYSIAANDAVKFALFSEHRDDRNADLMKLNQQMLFSLAEHRKKTGRDLMILQEMNLQLIKLIAMRTQDVSQYDQAARETQANALMDKVMEGIARNLSQVKPLDEGN